MRGRHAAAMNYAVFAVLAFPVAAVALLALVVLVKSRCRLPHLSAWTIAVAAPVAVFFVGECWVSWESRLVWWLTSVHGLSIVALVLQAVGLIRDSVLVVRFALVTAFIGASPFLAIDAFFLYLVASDFRDS
jgi:hypothetical protein